MDWIFSELLWCLNVLTLARDESAVSTNSWDVLLGIEGAWYPNPPYFPPWLGGILLKSWLIICTQSIQIF